MQTQNTAAIDGVVPTSIAGVATTHPHQLPPSKKRTRTDATAKAVRVGKTWTARLRRSGHDVYETGHKTRADAELAAAKELARRKAQGEPFGKGPKKTSFAHALRDYAKAKLPYMKGAKQEISRINFYLRQAKLPTLKVIPVEGAHVHFQVEFEEWTPERAIPKGLHAHRKQLAVKTADSMRLRAVLATKMVADISRHDLQQLVNKMREEGSEAATIGLERSLLRAFFNYARKKWSWDIADNPATGLDMPAINNNRERVLSEEEQVRLDEALSECRNRLVLPVMTLLRETAMRASEPLEYATWGDVRWDKCLLTLRDSKTDKRDVPLSPAALQALRDIGPGEPDEKIVNVTYESLRAAWRRACERANIDDLNIHDLRHTGATRMALKTANIFLVQALTGHKTLQMVQRYVNVTAADAVKVLHAPAAPAAPESQPAQESKNAEAPQPNIVLSPEQLALIANAVVQATSTAVAARAAEGVSPAPQTPAEPHAPLGESGGDIIDFRAARQRRTGGG